MKRKILSAIILMGCMVLLLASCSMNYSSVYRNSRKYSSGNAELECDISVLDIDYSSGKVNVVYHDKNTVIISEKNADKLDSDKAVHYFADGETLYIKFAASGKILNFSDIEKELTVYLPEELKLAEINIDTASADVFAERLSADEIEINTASGDVTVDSVFAETLDIETASGDIKVSANESVNDISADTASGKINIKASEVRNLEVDTASGRIDLEIGKADEIEADSASGNITLRISELSGGCEIDTASGDFTLYAREDMKFRMEIDTASGDFESALPFRKSGDEYIFNDGKVCINVETASGDITVIPY